MPLPGFRDQSRLPDFEVAVTFVDAEEGGRRTPATQGYRPDMIFADDPHAWMINPEFLRDDGSSYPVGARVPRSVRANMYVIYEERRPLVRDIVRIGQAVRMVEGSRTVATGEVTAIKNMPND
jgi:Elongation factor Tu C-terminal domain